MSQPVILAALTMTGLLLCPVAAREAGSPPEKENIMTARGTFDVKVTPQPQDDSAGGPFGRLFLDKQFHGDLDGASKGQMLAAGTAVEGSAGYVALELVTGTLHGKQGSFILQHKGTMRRNAPALQVTVVPDSGTGELAGIDGAMSIVIEGRKHSYSFEYTLAR